MESVSEAKGRSRPFSVTKARRCQLFPRLSVASLGKTRTYGRTIMLLTTLLVLHTTTTHVVHGRKTCITWVNGIAHNAAHMVEGQTELQRCFHSYIFYCHNPTAMHHDHDTLGYLSDLTQAGTQKLGRITTEVNSLVQHLRMALKRVGKRGVLLHICHSQGALITHLACKQLLPWEMKQMEVLAFGGAAALRSTPSTPFRRCINYYSVNDPLLMLVPSAAQALKSGLCLDSEFCFLSPRAGDPILDHSLIGETYLQAMVWEGQRYNRIYVSPVLRTVRGLWWWYVDWCQGVHTATQALVKCILRPMVYVVVVLWKLLQLCHRGVQHVVLEKFLRPLLHFVAALWEVLYRWLKWRLGRDEYQPVQRTRT